MRVSSIFKTARCVTIELADGGIFQTGQPYDIYVNDRLYGKTERVITSIYDLKPDTEYEIRVEGDGARAALTVRTDTEFVTLNVRDFGAKGDGICDDTLFIQAAVMACPKQSRVLIPEGTYRITSLFLKDDLNLELVKGAVLSAETDRTKFPVFPGLIQSYDEESEYNLGTWEGNPLPMFSGIITGVHVKHVKIYGQGTIEGNASDKSDNWWYHAKEKRIAFRPRMIFLNHCEDVVLQGIRVQNSPSWNIHPYFSDHLRFIDLTVLNPKDSPNTDGLDPESCKDVEIVGIYFSLGDDCIALKSGKIYMGAKYKTPCEDITIRQCCMRDGHGSITIGSEMAGGVKNLTVKDCLFFHTDRGLRIKTRRGRGQAAVIDGVLFERIRMDHVMTPFVINCFYFCDPDGHTEYVRSKEALPVDERTPRIRTMVFRNIEAENCHVAAAYLYGLPEQKIEKVIMEHVHVTYAEHPSCDVPAMMDGLEPCSRVGIFAENIEELTLRDVSVEGQDGEAFILKHIDRLEE
ncbi:MAG: glycoside hydrolase family 28 protein [Lachnospiraceae bacterium]|nr:glycoside hydrolase family 28 protein [Lachnospiraceae bacterium]